LQELLLKSNDLMQDTTANYLFQIYGLHGQMVTKRRNLTYEAFMGDPKNIENKKSLQILLCTDVAARGLDLPNVELIIQYDAPTDPSSFVHRVGRTARMGKNGQSIVFLSKHEDNYIEYLQVKRIPVIPYPENVINQELKQKVFSKLKQIALKDRDILEKGSQAFLTFVRAYREHQCEYIFRVRQLSFECLARAYVLTQIPKNMRELKKILPANLVASVKGAENAITGKKKNQRSKTAKEKKEEQRKLESIKFIWDKELCSTNIDNVPYKDSRKEKARKIREEKEAQANASSTDSDWKKEEKKKSVSQQKREIRDSKEINTRRKRKMYEQLEMNELENEARLLKKLKTGKISQEEFEELTGEKELEELIAAETHTKNTAGRNFVSSIEQKKQQTEGNNAFPMKKRKNKKKNR
jgi:ATP-dependent RNA helicase DDX55/SPB4